jgi:hypothetical protein
MDLSDEVQHHGRVRGAAGAGGGGSELLIFARQADP